MRRFDARGGDLSADGWAAVEAALRAEDLLLYPTDTLIALGGLALSAPAVARVRAAKGREPNKALPIVAADTAQVEAVCGRVSVLAAALAEAFWPGPLTLVCSAAAAVPAELIAGTGTVAVRVPALALTRRLCALAGPLVSTSANRAGQPPARNCVEAEAAVGAHVAIAIDGGPQEGAPSTIVDVTGKAPRLLRAGAVSWDDIERVVS